jgi:hypothetical protein
MAFFACIQIENDPVSDEQQHFLYCTELFARDYFDTSQVALHPLELFLFEMCSRFFQTFLFEKKTQNSFFFVQTPLQWHGCSGFQGPYSETCPSLLFHNFSVTSCAVLPNNLYISFKSIIYVDF